MYLKNVSNNNSPGRFFAITELKLMLAFVLLRYDVMTKDGKRPEATKFMNFFLPPTKAEILFKKRSI
jgi:cytochrome P450